MEPTKSDITIHLRFPPEVWSLIVNGFRDRKSSDELAYLWTSVRIVCRQFKQEIEDLFRTEHLPKIQLHAYNVIATRPQTQCSRYQMLPKHRPTISFAYEESHLEHPSRVVLAPTTRPNGPGAHGYSNPPGLFKKMSKIAGLGRLVEADESNPGHRLRLIEKSKGLFIVQVRGRLSDCLVPGLHINVQKFRISCDWKGLFNLFFTEMKVTTEILANDLECVHQVEDQSVEWPIYKSLDSLRPALREKAQRDHDMSHRLQMEMSQRTLRISRLVNPVQTWINAVDRPEDEARWSQEACRRRRHADRLIDLDVEGDINEVTLNNERNAIAVAETDRNVIWRRGMEACDTCLENDIECRVDGLARQESCTFCAEGRSRCEYTLATFNRPNHALQDYEMQMTLLEQQNRRRLLMARQQNEQPTEGSPEDTYHMHVSLLVHQNKERLLLALQRKRQNQALLGQPSGSSENSTLQDYQMQLMLHEQQNKKRLLMARQQNEQPNGHPSRSVMRNPLPNYQAQLRLLEEEDTRRR